ncbi:trypsin-like peptidase domain-containing protein [Candidatus Nomurabacteria bacterium]|nr:trypsin-like peptidase domain-containing protein [Candidatus Nomurabacteria bacterium]USN94473.1 MAG: trypsin-like peptidase domain-containing protein [Candidatus Nomurabacteria bacterium]
MEKENNNKKIFFISILSSILTLIAVFFVMFVFRYDISSYLTNLEKESIENQAGGLYVPSGQEALVIDVVDRSNPAVVSVVVTKEVSTSGTYNLSPFDLFFDDFFNFSLPDDSNEEKEKKDVGGGSGFFVSSDGLIVTNRHVVSDEDAEYSVVTIDGERHEARIVDIDPVIDIAILDVEGSGFPTLSFGDSDTLRLGQSVIAIGNALAEFQNSVSTGVVSGLSRSIVAGDGLGASEVIDRVIQTDAAINPGNSGGPLLNLSGEVIGVNVAVATSSENIGFAIPSSSVSQIVKSVIERGRIVRPQLGVRYVPITKTIADKNFLDFEYGVLVTSGGDRDLLAVLPGSPADKAGIVEGDIILEIDGEKITTDRNFAQIIREKNIGDTIRLKILSKGQEKTISVVLEEAAE